MFYTHGGVYCRDASLLITSCVCDNRQVFQKYPHIVTVSTVALEVQKSVHLALIEQHLFLIWQKDANSWTNEE